MNQSLANLRISLGLHERRLEVALQNTEPSEVIAYERRQVQRITTEIEMAEKEEKGK